MPSLRGVRQKLVNLHFLSYIRNAARSGNVRNYAKYAFGFCVIVYGSFPHLAKLIAVGALNQDSQNSFI